MTRPSPIVQQAIDTLTRIAGTLLQEHGPDDADLWRVSKALAVLYGPGPQKKGTKGKGRRIKAHTEAGIPITITADMLDDNDGL